MERRIERASWDVLHVAHTTVRFKAHETVFAQGDRCAAVMYIEKGRVKLTVTSPCGRKAVVAILHAGAFFGEAALAGQRRRTSTAETVTASTITMVKTAAMRRGLCEEKALAACFRAHLLAINSRIEADLVATVTRRGRTNRAGPPSAANC